MSALLSIILAVSWLVTFVIGMRVAIEKEREIEGAILCLLWGPLGIVCVCLLPERKYAQHGDDNQEQAAKALRKLSKFR